MIENNLSKNTGVSIMNNDEKPPGNNKASLIIFMRHPEIDKVKTRLSATTSSEFALLFYLKCSSNLINEIRNIQGIDKYLFYSDRNEKYETELIPGFFYTDQIYGDLGLRMKHAIESVLSKGTSKALILGTDIPDLNTEIINRAVNELDQNDIVLGPANDGGYYLIGMNNMQSFLFENIEFGTPLVLSETVSLIKKSGLKYSLLPELIDIDTEEDLLYWLNESGNSYIKGEIKIIYNKTKKGM